MLKDEIECILREGRVLNLPSVPKLEEMLNECKICSICNQEAIIERNDMCSDCVTQSLL